MKLVVDTNVVFSALIAGGKTRELIITEDLELSIPEYFFKELSNNLDEIEEKTGLERQEIEILLNLLFEEMHVIPREEFEDKLDMARDLIADTDPDDAPFLAVALQLEAGIWSDDEHFQEQTKIEVWRTHELLEKL